MNEDSNKKIEYFLSFLSCSSVFVRSLAMLYVESPDNDGVGQRDMLGCVFWGKDVWDDRYTAFYPPLFFFSDLTILS